MMAKFRMFDGGMDEAAARCALCESMAAKERFRRNIVCLLLDESELLSSELLALIARRRICKQRFIHNTQHFTNKLW